MSVTYTKSWGYTDTNPIGTTPLAVDMYKLAYASDFGVRVPNSREKKQEENVRGGINVYYGNVTSPTDQPENVRIAKADIANVYAGRPEIDPVFWAPQKRGSKLLWVTEDVLRVINDTTGEYIDLPVSATTTLTYAISPHFTEAELFAFFKRHASFGFNAADSNSRIAAMMRGQLALV